MPTRLRFSASYQSIITPKCRTNATSKSPSTATAGIWSGFNPQPMSRSLNRGAASFSLCLTVPAPLPVSSSPTPSLAAPTASPFPASQPPPCAKTGTAPVRACFRSSNATTTACRFKSRKNISRAANLLKSTLNYRKVNTSNERQNNARLSFHIRNSSRWIAHTQKGQMAHSQRPSDPMSKRLSRQPSPIRRITICAGKYPSFGRGWRRNEKAS